MEARPKPIVSWLFAIDFLLVLSGLISIMCAKTALVGYMLLFSGIVFLGIIAAVYVPVSSQKVMKLIDPRKRSRSEK